MFLSAVILYPLMGLLSTVVASAVVWFSKPSIIVKYGMKFILHSCGLRVKYVTVGKIRYCYAERGTPSQNNPTIVLVHGFSASKDMWVQIVKRIPKDVHIIALDLLGHGDTTVPECGEDISLERLTMCIKENLSAIGMDRRPFHIVGTSLGGILAGLYASMYKSDLNKITMICPAVRTPVETKFMQEIRSGYCRLIPDDVEGLQTMIDSCVYKKNKINKQVLSGFLELRKKRNPFYTRLFEEIRVTEADPIKSVELENKGRDIKAPLQIIWGKHDELIHPSGAEYLRSEIPSCVRVDMIDRCGHSVNMDRPGQVTKCLLEFRGELP